MNTTRGAAGPPPLLERRSGLHAGLASGGAGCGLVLVSSLETSKSEVRSERLIIDETHREITRSPTPCGLRPCVRSLADNSGRCGRDHNSDPESWHRRQNVARGRERKCLQRRRCPHGAAAHLSFVICHVSRLDPSSGFFSRVSRSVPFSKKGPRAGPGVL